MLKTLPRNRLIPDWTDDGTLDKYLEQKELIKEELPADICPLCERKMRCIGASRMGQKLYVCDRCE